MSLPLWLGANPNRSPENKRLKHLQAIFALLSGLDNLKEQCYLRGKQNTFGLCGHQCLRTLEMHFSWTVGVLGCSGGYVGTGEIGQDQSLERS